jgi:hypothetical protein
MDRITKSLLEEFVRTATLETLQEDTQFEHFCGSLIASRHYAESFDSEDIVVGAGGDCGIDCIAILINGRLITDPEEVSDLAESGSFLDVTFLFVQAERSSSFEVAKIGSFGFGIQDFFSETPVLVRNERVQLAAQVSNEIFRRSAQFHKGNPQCFLYYATTGRWTNDANLVARRDSVKEDLTNLNLFRKVDFDCIGAEKLHELYRQLKNALHAEVVFPSRTTLPDLPGVQQAYLGLLPATEFLKLIENETGEVINSVFYDNVRAWQEWNPVNIDIRDTIDDPQKKNYFPLMNNGITIVARQIIPTGNRLVIEDYQIVNGCQTSYVLHETRDNLTPDTLVPVRLVATTDPVIKNLIAKATNRQTAVSDDQLFALSDFPKNLEAYFLTYRNDQALYCERRSKQYSSDPTIQKIRVVDLRTLIKAFASMFLELPHRTTRNYKALRESIGISIFVRDHRLEPYYVAGYAHFRLEYLFRTQVIASNLRPARYHILLAFRLLAKNQTLPTMNSHQMATFSGDLCAILWDQDESTQLFQQAAGIVTEIAAGNLDRDNIRTQPFTEALIQHFRPQTH